MNKKTLIPIFFSIIVIASGFVQFRNTTKGVKNKIQNYTVTQELVLYSGKKNLISHVLIGTTALSLLQSTYKTEIKGQNENAFVTSIDNRIADSQKKEFWAFYVNGKQAQVGAGSYKLKNNDTIVWKIETY